jgi:hypothetical protein
MGLERADARHALPRRVCPQRRWQLYRACPRHRPGSQHTDTGHEHADGRADLGTYKHADDRAADCGAADRYADLDADQSADHRAADRNTDRGAHKHACSQPHGYAVAQQPGL